MNISLVTEKEIDLWKKHLVRKHSAVIGSFKLNKIDRKSESRECLKFYETGSCKRCELSCTTVCKEVLSFVNSKGLIINESQFFDILE